MEVHSPNQLLANFRMTEGIRTVVRKDFDNVLLDQYKSIGGEVLHAKVASIEEKRTKYTSLWEIKQSYLAILWSEPTEQTALSADT